MPEHLDPELVALRERVQTFIDDELRPLEERLDEGAELGDVDAALRAEVRARSREAGIFGMPQPREFGGTEAGPLARTVARETVAAANLRTGSFVFGPYPGVLEGAEGQLRDQYLEPLMRGEKAAGFGFTEPTGPDAGRPTYAVPDGDQLLVTGRKSYITNGPFCDFYNVLVNVEAGEGSEGGMAMIAIDRDTPGLTIPREFSTMDGARHSEVAFDRCAVPRWHVIGEVGGGMNRALGHIGEERLEGAAGSSGIAMWTVQYTREHISRPHRQGGTLGDREGVRRIFAEMMIDTYAIRATTYRTARLAESGVDVLNEGSMAKVFAAEAVGRIVDQAIQLAGGDALTSGHPLERLYRRVRALRIGGGATEIVRLSIARGMLEFDSGRV